MTYVLMMVQSQIHERPVLADNNIFMIDKAATLFLLADCIIHTECTLLDSQRAYGTNIYHEPSQMWNTIYIGLISGKN